MGPRTFSLTIVLAATALFCGTIATNLLLDPQGVFGSNLFKIDVTQNFRFARFATYRASAAHYDAFFFASSRGGAFDLQDLARRMNVNAVADFSVPGGSPSDFLPMLRYAIRDKAERSERSERSAGERMLPGGARGPRR